MNKKLFWVLILVIALSLIGTGTALAAPNTSGGSGAIWTTDGSCGTAQQDVNHFEIGDHVYINGDGFNANTQYYWSIKGKPGKASGDPGVTVADGYFTTDANGNFCFDAYAVKSDDWGEYTVKFGNKGDNYRVEGEDPTETPPPTGTPTPPTPTPTKTPTETPTQTPTPTTTPEEKVYTISTDSVCRVENGTVDYLTTIYASEATTGVLKVLWYYPNGNAFVTGETTLGPISLSAGNNNLESSMTKAELTAAIGESNLTGGNPANDVNYDKLEMYQYELRLYIDGQETVVSNKAALWIANCDQTSKSSKPSCPTCGAPVWERAYDGMAMVWFSDTPCEICRDGGEWVIKLHRLVRFWSETPFVLEYPADVFYEPDVVSGADGSTYYVLQLEADIADKVIIWDEDGHGNRFRDHGDVFKYSACSVAPGYYDAPDGVAQWKPGHTTSDWVTFLLNEGYFPRTYEGARDAYTWANELRNEGSLALPSR